MNWIGYYVDLTNQLENNHFKNTQREKETEKTKIKTGRRKKPFSIVNNEICFFNLLFVVEIMNTLPCGLIELLIVVSLIGTCAQAGE